MADNLYRKIYSLLNDAGFYSSLNNPVATMR